MGFTREDVCKTVALFETWDKLSNTIEDLDEHRSTLQGAEKGKVTRTISGYEKQIEQIRQELEELPARPMDPKEAFASLLGLGSRVEHTFTYAKDAFLERVAWDPKEALGWAAESVVRAQVHWEIVKSAMAAENYDEMVRRLRAADADNDERLLDGGSPATSTSMFSNAVTLAEHWARQGARRWGPKVLLRMADEIYGDRVASWKLLHGEGEDDA